MNEPDHEHRSLYCVFICALRGSKPAKICQGFLDVLKAGNVEVIVALQIYAVSREKETLFEHKQCSEITRLDNYSTWSWKCRAATNVNSSRWYHCHPNICLIALLINISFLFIRTVPYNSPVMEKGVLRRVRTGKLQGFMFILVCFTSTGKWRERGKKTDWTCLDFWKLEYFPFCFLRAIEILWP